MSRLRAALPLLLLIAIGVVLWATGTLDRLRPEHLIEQQHVMRHAIATHPLAAWGIYIGILTLAIATGIPGAIVVILAGGMFFGILHATILSAIGEVLGSLLLYFAARHAFGSGERPPPKMAERVRRGYLQHPLSYTLFLRLVPVLPFGGVTVALAWLRCPIWLFTLATAIGGSVMLIFETSIGAGLGHALRHGKTLSPHMLLQPRVLIPVLALAMLALVPMLIQRWRQRAPP
ncbi:MAG: TVP38/TMEM64 family protein [Rhodanobacteraceae bacterium]